MFELQVDLHGNLWYPNGLAQKPVIGEFIFGYTNYFRVNEQQRVKVPLKVKRRMTGTLIAIGGALNLDGPLLSEFFKRSGGPDGRIVILPTASSLPDCGEDYAAELARLGLRTPAQILPVHTREEAYCPDTCQAMEEATGLFITGGDQARLTGVIRGTPLYQAIRTMFYRGGTVAGTSAGTAALSNIMIASGNSGALPQHNVATIDSGLGLIQSCIFDQHFRQRNRIGRLVNAVSRYPALIGIGVDEDTAAIIEEGQLSVMGSSVVTIVDGRALKQERLQNEIENRVTLPGQVEVQTLTAGEMYNLTRGPILDRKQGNHAL